MAMSIGTAVPAVQGKLALVPRTVVVSYTTSTQNGLTHSVGVYWQCTTPPATSIATSEKKPTGAEEHVLGAVAARFELGDGDGIGVPDRLRLGVTATLLDLEWEGEIVIDPVWLGDGGREWEFVRDGVGDWEGRRESIMSLSCAAWASMASDDM
jgi:hypothetical protein